MAKKNISVAGFTKDQRAKELEKVKKKYSKKGYNFIEYIDDGVTKSIAIFEVDDSILKKEKSKNLITIGIIIMIFAFFIYPKDNSMEITPNSVKEAWPLTVEKATLKCYKDGDIVSPVVIVNGVSYGLTGFADNKYGQSNLDAFNKVWKPNPEIKNAYISISEISNLAKSLCK